ncbi:DUF2125 domain-containing protein [Roseovarius aquimarinus]|uniref:DUF2125 domain-containing protein n=1 Tax=Roseovarius aquimarinus TaxID=1229156 RepID=A0ABW7I5Q2_9RHOB
MLAIVLALAAGWAGYWFIGSSAVKSGVADWFEDRRAEGWTAEYGALSVAGFPNRFDTTLDAVALEDPASGLGWRAPFIQIMALSYRPNHVIVIWPETQSFTDRGRAMTLDSTDMRASLVVAPSTALAPERVALTAEGLSLRPEGAALSEALSASSLRLAAERVEGAEARYHLGLAAADVAPAASLLAQIEGGGDLPRVIDSITADITADFTAPWDRAAIEAARPQPTRIEIIGMAMAWGGMALDAAGTLEVDAGGMPSGTLTLTARGWRDMLDAAEASSLLTSDMATTAERALTMMSGGQDTLEMPLRFGEGRVWIGPLPIAPAPVLRLQ